MNLIKLNATESTNIFLKDLSKHNELDNFTVVVTDNQTKGQGQMGSVWSSERDKNLIISVLIKHIDFKISNQFYLSKIVSLAICECLETFLNVKLTIKWPNDILAVHSKIAGVLIENSVKESKIRQSVVGIGLNVNQENFKGLPRATSMKLIASRQFDLELLLNEIIKCLKEKVELLNLKQFDQIDKTYLKKLYNMNTPAMYKDDQGNQFIGKIIGVSENGKLIIELENDKVVKFDLKEIEYMRL